MTLEVISLIWQSAGSISVGGLTLSVYSCLLWLRWVLTAHGPLSRCSARVSHCRGFSLWLTVSRVCGLQALWLRLSCPVGVWGLPRTGIEPTPPAWAGKCFMTEPARRTGRRKYFGGVVGGVVIILKHKCIYPTSAWSPSDWVLVTSTAHYIYKELKWLGNLSLFFHCQHFGPGSVLRNQTTI